MTWDADTLYPPVCVREGAKKAMSSLTSCSIQDGVFNVDKPAGWTSHDVVARVRVLTRIKRVGHAGTLDPQATGVLVICFGKGTKISSLLMACDKTYEAVLRLGEATDTQDAEGRVIQSTPVPTCILEGLSDTLAAFVGEIRQVPPMYSAVKVGGEPLYNAARRGEVVARAARTVHIREIHLDDVRERDVSFRVTCSKGTYVRTLCADVGEKLGVGGHLLSLRRVRSGGFHVADAVTVDALEDAVRHGVWEQKAHPLDAALAGLPAVFLEGLQIRRVINGAPVRWSAIQRAGDFRQGDALRLLDEDGRLIAIGRARVASNAARQNDLVYSVETVLGATQGVCKEEESCP